MKGYKFILMLALTGAVACNKGDEPYVPPVDPEPTNVLYNGIVLPDVWPPKTYMSTSAEPMRCDYLTTRHPDVVPIDLGRQLFFDDFLIKSTTLTRKFYTATKYVGNPILRAETALETEKAFPGLGPKDGGVWWDPDEQIFKMWYEAGWLKAMAYATSTDGLNWVKPDLVNGTNQLISLAGLKPNSCAVVLDYGATDGWKYKMFFREPNETATDNKGWAILSKDGINWGSKTKTGPCGDRSTMFYNPFRKVWVYSIRNTSELGTTTYPYRCRYYKEGEKFFDGANWDKSSVVFWCRADKNDTQDPVIQLDPQLYNLTAVAYESIMLADFQILVDENKPAMNAGRPKVTNLQLGFSRDGFNWDRPCRENNIPSTQVKGSWDRGYVQSVGGICAVMGDQLWFWYIGFAGNEDRKGESAALHSNMATGIAYMRRDGFASMSGNGELTTVPVKFKGGYLFVNVNCPSGDFAAEVLDENGKVVSGYEMENCKVVNANSTIARVEWKNNADLLSLAGKKVSFRFSQKSGDFYSFWVSTSTKGESNGYVAGGGPGFTSNIDTKGIDAYGKTIVLK